MPIVSVVLCTITKHNQISLFFAILLPIVGGTVAVLTVETLFLKGGQLTIIIGNVMVIAFIY